ncbi:MAG: hypothetical protein AAB388_00335 [Patescibacteria group bacterium]
MKKLLILPGNGAHNKAWGEAAAEALLPHFDIVYLQHYNHWDTQNAAIDFAAEIEKISITVEGTDEDEPGDWYVCAKSVGALLAILAFGGGAIDPLKCVFFGMPLAMASEGIFKDDWSLLKEFVVPTFAFHNEHDPTADYSFTKEKLDAFAPAMTFKTLSGSTHDYLDFASYLPDITNFLRS